MERLEDSGGNAVGAYSGVDSIVAYQDSQFRDIDEPQRLEEVSQTPTFSSVNEKQVQIFRVTRVSGKPEEAASIRRVSRI